MAASRGMTRAMKAHKGAETKSSLYGGLLFFCAREVKLSFSMKVRDLIKRLEGDGWRLARTKGSHRQYHHPAKPGPLLLRAIHRWTFHREH